MTQEEIIEGNKLIAEFIGFASHENTAAEKDFFKGYPKSIEAHTIGYNVPYNFFETTVEKKSGISGNSNWIDAFCKIDSSKCTEVVWLAKMKFHSSWDWLMPVVEKIEAMQNRDVDARITIERDTCNIYFNNGTSQYEFNTWEQSNKLKCVYEHLVEFIKWYNKL
jgi:hypothetical protein